MNFAYIYIVSFVGGMPIAARWTPGEAESTITTWINQHPETSRDDYEVRQLPLPNLRYTLIGILADMGITVTDWHTALVNKAQTGDGGLALIQAYLCECGPMDPLAQALEKIRDPEQLKQTGIPMTMNGEVLVPDSMDTLLEFFQKKYNEVR